MKKTIFFLLLLLPYSPPALAYQKGVALGLYAKEPNYPYSQDLKEIRKMGADHISLVISWYQKDIHSTKIYPYWKPVGDFDTLPDKKLEEIIQEAHQLGLQVFLFPILRIEIRKDKEWRGVIAPRNHRQWLASYRNFTLHYAKLAAKNHIELFSIGSELCSMEPETSFWKKLIAQVRSFYQGQLLYSANWDHYKQIEFWDDLDFLGLNGYYELTKSSTPTLDELIRQWWTIENDLANWQEHHHKQIVLTEIGYPSVDGTCGKPWDYTREAAIDVEEQALCYEAFFLSWNSSQKLAGVYFWNWYGQGGPNDRSYTPRGKPAQQVLTKWFSKDASPSSSPLSSVSPSSPAEGPQKKATTISRQVPPLPSS